MYRALRRRTLALRWRATPEPLAILSMTPSFAISLDALSGWLHARLSSLQFENTVATGLILGVMACADLGGTITHTAIGYGSVELSGGDPTRGERVSGCQATGASAALCVGVR